MPPTLDGSALHVILPQERSHAAVPRCHWQHKKAPAAAEALEKQKNLARG